MDDERPHADAARAMTTVLRYQQRAGRFGRDVRSGYDVHADDTRMAMETDGADEPSSGVGYVVDAAAVAAAIVERLLAGRTLKPPPPPASR
jgi:hypothetical protein